MPNSGGNSTFLLKQQSVNPSPFPVDSFVKCFAEECMHREVIGPKLCSWTILSDTSSDSLRMLLYMFAEHALPSKVFVAQHSVQVCVKVDQLSHSPTSFFFFLHPVQVCVEIYQPSHSSTSLFLFLHSIQVCVEVH